MSMKSELRQANDVSESIVIPIGAVRRILDIYLPEHLYVYDAAIKGTSLSCSLNPTRYPYTARPIFNYITAPTATLFACQLAYVLIGGMFMTQHPIASPIGTWERFFEMRDKAFLRVARISLRFDAEVANRRPIKASIGIDRAIHLRKRIHCTMSFEIGKGLSGQIHGVIVG